MEPSSAMGEGQGEGLDSTAHSAWKVANESSTSTAVAALREAVWLVAF